MVAVRLKGRHNLIKISMRPAIARVAVASARSTRNFPTSANIAPPSTPHRRRRSERATTTHLRYRARSARNPFRWSPTCIWANQARHLRPPAATSSLIPCFSSSIRVLTPSIASRVLSRSPCSRVRSLSMHSCSSLSLYTLAFSRPSFRPNSCTLLDSSCPRSLAPLDRTSKKDRARKASARFKRLQNDCKTAAK